MDYINFTEINVQVDNDQLYCRDANFVVGKDLNGVFELNSTTPKYFSPSSITQGTMTFNYYVTGADPLYNAIFEEAKPIHVNIGGAYIESGYLGSYEFQVNKNHPLIVTATVHFYEKLKGEVVKQSEPILPRGVLSVRDINLSDASEIPEKSILSASYSYSTEITPSFDIEENPESTEVILRRVIPGTKDIQSSFQTYDYSVDIDLSMPTHELTLGFENLDFKVSGPVISTNFDANNGENIIRSFEISQGVVDDAPKINSISPTSGPIFTEVIVSGENLGHPVSVALSEYTCSFTSINKDAIEVKIPEEAYEGYEAPFRVFTNGGQVITTGRFEVTF